MFRLPEDGALINRLGFNNKGADVAKHNLESQSKRLKKARLSGAVLGINIGKNKTSENAIADYLTMFDAMSGMADYITLNISSPNTEGLRDLQAASALSELLDAVCNRREQLGVHVPLWLKLAPDLSDEQCEAAAETIKNYSVDALVISNTTIERPASLQGVLKGEQGGLSGKPLLLPSTAKLRLFYKLLGDNIPLVGVGGVSGAEDAYSKIRAGASLVQLYTALGYHGFGLVRDINVGLLNLLKQDGYSHIREAIGAHAQ
jgi:dihydroorotate dehydrogenase